VTLGIGEAGARVVRQVHERTGSFPVVRQWRSLASRTGVRVIFSAAQMVVYGLNALEGRAPDLGLDIGTPYVFTGSAFSSNWAWRRFDWRLPDLGLRDWHCLVLGGLCLQPFEGFPPLSTLR
jgi:hypothetical protein